MAPGTVVDVPLSVNGTAAANVENAGAEKNGKNLSKGGASKFERPVQLYEDVTEVPPEFVTGIDIKNPPNIATKEGDADCEVPVIDLLPLITRGAVDKQGADHERAAKKVVEEIGRACQKWGFLQVVNHGIPEDLMDRLMEVTNEFFLMPLEEKQVYAVEPGGLEGYGRIDLGTVYRQWTDTLRHTVRPKPAPEKDRMPAKPEAYRGLIKEYNQGIENLFQVVFRALSEFLGLEPDSLRKSFEDDWHMIVRLNYYPKCPEPDKVMGLGAHKDFGCMTVLMQDEVGGLQVTKPGCEDVWLDVKPRKGSLLINIANQVEILSNGRFHSCLHRVLTNRNKARISVAAFANPGPDCIIRPLPDLLEKTQQLPFYKELVFKDYFPNVKKDWNAGIPAHIRYEINRS